MQLSALLHHAQQTCLLFGAATQPLGDIARQRIVQCSDSGPHLRLGGGHLGQVLALHVLHELLLDDFELLRGHHGLQLLHGATGSCCQDQGQFRVRFTASSGSSVRSLLHFGRFIMITVGPGACQGDGQGHARIDQLGLRS